MKNILIGLIIFLFLDGCTDTPVQPPILVQAPVIKEYSYFTEVDKDSDYLIYGFYKHLEIIPFQIMYDFEFQLEMYDDDVLISTTRGYAVSKDRADVPFKFFPGEFSLPIISIVDTIMWGYVASIPIDILRIGRGWLQLTYTYYTNNSGLSKQVIVSKKIEIFN